MFGFSFLQPLFLLGTLFIAVPLAIHLYVKSRHKKMPFSSLQLLLETIDKRKKSRTLTNILLLLIRALLIVLLSLALARPYLTAQIREYTPTSHQSTVIILDNSTSMDLVENDKSLFETGAKLARRFIRNSLSGGDEALVLPLIQYSRSKQTFRRDSDLLGNDLDRIKIAHGSVNWPGTILSARNLLLGKENPRIIIISDFAAGDWTNLPDIEESKIPINVFSLAPKYYRNMALGGLAITPKAPLAGEKTHFEVSLQYSSNEPFIPGAHLSFYKAGILQARKSLKSIREKEQLDFYTTFDSPGEAKGYFLLETDNLVADNRLDFFLTVRDKIKVLTIDGDPKATGGLGESFYLNAAISPQREHSFYDLTTIPLKDLDRINLADFTVVFLVDPPRPSAKLLTNLRKYVENGGSLALVPGSQIDPLNFNETFGKAPVGKTPLSPVTLQLRMHRQTPQKVLLPDEGLFKLGSIDNVSFTKYFQSEKNQQSEAYEPLISFADNFPYVVEGAYGQGKVIVFTSAFDNEWNDLCLGPYFLPLVYNITNRLSTSNKLISKRAEKRTEALLTPTLDHGVSLNIYPAESELGYLDRVTIANKLGNRSIDFLSPEENFAPTIAAQSFWNTRQWRILLLLFLGLLVIEEMVANAKTA